MWKICLLLGILVIAVSAAPQAPAAEEKPEPVKFNLCFIMRFDFGISAGVN